MDEKEVKILHTKSKNQTCELDKVYESQEVKFTLLGVIKED